MAKIDDPRHSRPLDVHRWSEHPEVKALVGEVWEGYLPPEIAGEQGPGPKSTCVPNRTFITFAANGGFEPISLKNSSLIEV